MSQKSSFQSYVPEYSSKETSADPRRSSTNQERHLEAYFVNANQQQVNYPPLEQESQEKDLNLFDLAPLGVFCGKNSLPPRPHSGKHSKKQTLDGPIKEISLKYPSRENETSDITPNRGCVENGQSPLDRLYAHIKKKSLDSQGANRREAYEGQKDVDDFTKSTKTGLEGKIFKKILHKVSGSNPSCLNSSNNFLEQKHTRNNSNKAQDRSLTSQNQNIPKPRIFGELDHKDKSNVLNEQEGFSERKVPEIRIHSEKPSDFFDFYKGEIFDPKPSLPPKVESGFLQMKQNQGDDGDFYSTQQINKIIDDEEEPHHWLIPNVQSDVASRKQSAAMSYTSSQAPQQIANSDTKKSNASFLSSDSTVDSEFNNYDFVNTSDNSSSFYNTRSYEHNTPTKIDSFRRNHDVLDIF